MSAKAICPDCGGNGFQAMHWCNQPSHKWLNEHTAKALKTQQSEFVERLEARASDLEKSLQMQSVSVDTYRGRRASAKELRRLAAQYREDQSNE